MAAVRLTTVLRGRGRRGSGGGREVGCEPVEMTAPAGAVVDDGLLIAAGGAIPTGLATDDRPEQRDPG